MTNDVECFSFEHNQYEDEVSKRVLNQGLPRLLDLYDKYDVDATFFYTGNIVELEPEVVDIVKERGNHELGCHGYSHEIECGFDCMLPETQEEHLRKSKDIIEKTANAEIISFRAPALRIGQETLPLAEKLGFKLDSSVSSQRFDVGLSFGTKEKIKWLFAPRDVYHPSKDNPYRKGNLKILEIPVSALILPYIGTTSRNFGKAFKLIEKIIINEARKNNKKPVCFITHPNEVTDLECTEDEGEEYRCDESHKRFFQERFRLKLKLKKLGMEGIKNLEERIKLAKLHNFKFTTLKKYAEVIKT
jgi:peptidoglycan/xylan/chitin deacetylase (PgdA/CDA1 family)